jgi:hypothetical protein
MITAFDEYVDGWTAPIEYTLKHRDPATGADSTFNAGGMTPSLILTDKNGNQITITGTVEWADSSVSRIRFKPSATDLVASKSPYTLHWKVTDETSKVAYYPQGTPIRVKVHAK